MEIEEYIANFEKLRSREPEPVQEGRHPIPMNSFTINGFMLGPNVCLEVHLITLPSSDYEREILIKTLAEAMSEVSEYHACLSLNQKNDFILFDRFSPDHVTASDFVSRTKQLGAVYLHLQQKINPDEVL